MACPISKDNLFDCATVGGGGLQAKMILINWADIANARTLTIDVTTKRITDLLLPLGAKGYQYTFPKGSTLQPSTPLRTVDRGIDTFDHTIDAIAQQITQVYREELAKMRFTPVVALVSRKDGVWEMYGRGSGLKMSAIDYQPGSADTAGTMPFTLMTPSDEPGEIALPIELFDTDVATTEALIATLLVAAV